MCKKRYLLKLTWYITQHYSRVHFMKRVHPFLSQRALRFLHHQRKRRQVYPYYKPFRLVFISYQQLQMLILAVLFFKYKCLSLWHPRCQLWVACVVFSQFIPIKCKFCLFAATFVTYMSHAITYIKIFVMLIVIGVFIAIIIENTFRLCGSIHFLVSLIARSRIRCESADFDALLPFNTCKFLM